MIIVWDEIGDRGFEVGVDRGVLYPPTGPGVPWNGITSIIEKPDVEVSTVYFDGMKINELAQPGSFLASLKALTYPSEFDVLDGTSLFITGVYLADQPLKTFGLSYRTLKGNDVDGIDLGYKIHVVYNVLAVPTDVENDTIGADITPKEFEWDLSAIPEEISGFRPTAHLIFDSTEMNPALLSGIEDILYGDDDTDAALIPISELIDYLSTWFSIAITDNGDGTWTADISEDSDLDLDVILQMFTIFNINATYVDADTYIITDTG